MTTLFANSPPPSRSATTHSPDALRKIMYCSISERLRQAAAQAVDAFTASTKRRNAGKSVPSACHVYYRSQRTATKSARTLGTLRLQTGDGETGAVDALPALLDSGGLRLQCTVSEYLANTAEFRALASDIAAQDTGVLKVDKRLRKLAQIYTELFEPARIDDVRLSIPGDTDPSSWRRDVLASHRLIMDFLRLFVSMCSTEKPVEHYANQQAHTVKIQDVSTIIVDGVVMNFIAARKAALFTLAINGTERISIESFCRNYHRYPVGVTAVNYSNMFAQAIHGLRKTLVSIRVDKVMPKYRTVTGLAIQTNVPVEVLDEWLRLWRQ